MDADLDTLAIALYVKIDDELKARPELVKPRPAGGIAPKLSDAELVTVAVMQVLLGYRSERRWLRHLGKLQRHLFPYQPKQAGYNKRLRASLPLIQHIIRVLAVDTDFWFEQPLDPGLHAGGVRPVEADQSSVPTPPVGRLRLLRPPTPGSSGGRSFI